MALNIHAFLLIVTQNVINGPGLRQLGILGIPGNCQVVNTEITVIGHCHLEVELGLAGNPNVDRCTGAANAMAQMDRTVGIAVVDVHKAGAYLGSTGQLEVQCTVTDGGLTLVDPDILVATPVTLVPLRRAVVRRCGSNHILGIVLISGQTDGQIQISHALLLGQLQDHYPQLSRQVCGGTVGKIDGIAIGGTHKNRIEDRFVGLLGKNVFGLLSVGKLTGANTILVQNFHGGHFIPAVEAAILGHHQLVFPPVDTALITVPAEAQKHRCIAVFISAAQQGRNPAQYGHPRTHSNPEAVP